MTVRHGLWLRVRHICCVTAHHTHVCVRVPDEYKSALLLAHSQTQNEKFAPCGRNHILVASRLTGHVTQRGYGTGRQARSRDLHRHHGRTCRLLNSSSLGRRAASPWLCLHHWKDLRRLRYRLLMPDWRGGWSNCMIRSLEGSLLCSSRFLAAMALSFFRCLPLVILVRRWERSHAPDFRWKRIGPEPNMVQGLISSQANIGVVHKEFVEQVCQLVRESGKRICVSLDCSACPSVCIHLENSRFTLRAPRCTWMALLSGSCSQPGIDVSSIVPHICTIREI